MTRSDARRLGRGASVMLVVLASLVLAGGQVLADTRLHHSGTTGAYSFADTAGSPGATCVYQGTAGHLEFDHARVKAPKVYWPGSTGFTSGTVGWRLILQHWDGHSWDTVRTSSEVRGLATTTHAAPLTARSITWAAPHDRKYRVEAKVRWMTPDADTIGSVLVSIDHLKRDYDGSVGAACKASVPTV